ncbi:MAG TPA: CvpA family protein [Syntrophomonadaceae bacterium]|nr:CvpA family protein [Syntrophomonadaceae bacterium]
MNKLDLILIIIFLLACIRGYRRGFFASLTSIVALVIGILVAWNFRELVVANLEARYSLVSRLANWLEMKIPALAAARSGQELLNQIPLPGLLPGGISLPADALPISIQISEALLGIAAFIVLFFLTRWAVKIFASLFDGLFRQGALGMLNSLGGLILSMVKYVIIVLVLFALINPLLGAAALIGNHNSSLNESIETSRVLDLLDTGKDKLKYWFLYEAEPLPVKQNQKIDL